VAFLKSPVGQMFHQFFGENMLRADVCNAVEELGQLLDHTGPVAQSERNAARIFNADHCFFVTNGTSTSNKMVWHHTVAPGDVVVVDRNCHKSHPAQHHHDRRGAGVPDAHAQPLRHHRADPGERVLARDAIQRKIAANPLLAGVDAKKVQAAHPDADAEHLRRRALQHRDDQAKLDGYVDTLHFDEAWLPHAAFHKFYGSSTRWARTARGRRTMVFATQSTHKLLAGISQASRCWCRTQTRAQARPPPVQRGLPDAHQRPARSTPSSPAATWPRR
jgi:arginine decarboxylase